MIGIQSRQENTRNSGLLAEAVEEGDQSPGLDGGEGVCDTY
jgi:hypothetical protein